MQTHIGRVIKMYVAGAGGAGIDICAASTVSVRLRDSNPSVIRTSVGGVARNITENVARTGIPAVFLTAVGNDVFGRAIIEESSRAGVDMSRVFMSEELRTSAYLSILDGSGDMFAAASDYSTLSALPESYFHDNADVLKGAAAIVADANLSREQLAALMAEKGDTPLFFDPVSAAKAPVILDFLSSVYMLKPNRMELEALTGMACGTDSGMVSACRRLIERGCRIVAVSLGARGCCVVDAEGRAVFRGLMPKKGMVNATGAGDAFLAGFISAFCRGERLSDQIDSALAAGLIAVDSEDTINRSMSEKLIKETAEKYRRKEE